VVNFLVPFPSAEAMARAEKDQLMSRDIRKRSVVIAGHATSISLEAEFWEALKIIAENRGLSLNALVAAIDSERSGNLSSALRLLVLEELQAALRQQASNADSHDIAREKD
jgi:predicted DNA-binding ribbon-helix-helix protein